MSANEKLLTVNEAAAYLGISPTTLRRWTNAGILECLRINGRGDRRFSRLCLDAARAPKKTGRPRKRNF
ncbi:MAG: helix-turn-helix domain-containing protein [bacterium]|nr:helix-turn-helix domain-containing protein [bacterium]